MARSPDNKGAPNNSDLKPRREASDETKQALGRLAVEKSQKK